MRSFKWYCKIFSIVFLYLSLAIVASIYCLPAVKKQHFKGRIERSLAQMYDKDDLGASALFAGNFINLGFWDLPIHKGKISICERIESERNLYRLVGKKLELDGSERVLDVGCGEGVGCALMLQEFSLKEIHGIDLSLAQISRAERINAVSMQKNRGRIFFKKGAAENIPYEPCSFEKIFSINAAQHFESLEKFAKEASRTLKPKGKVVIAALFGTSEKSQQLLAKNILTIKNGIDKTPTVCKFEEILKRNGFCHVKIESIGKNVWQGFDRWVAQGSLKDSWTRNWYKEYRNGLLDYYIVSAEKRE